MYLFLDPRSPREITVGVCDKNNPPKFKIYNRERCSLLEFVDKFFESRFEKLKNLKGLVVIAGPGGFSNVRNTVLFANILIFALGTPVTEIKPKRDESKELIFRRGLEILKKQSKKISYIRPFYDSEPHITVSKAGKGFSC